MGDSGAKIIKTTVDPVLKLLPGVQLSPGLKTGSSLCEKVKEALGW